MLMEQLSAASESSLFGTPIGQFQQRPYPWPWLELPASHLSGTSTLVLRVLGKSGIDMCIMKLQGLQANKEL
jgi:hypothetical protein